MKLTIYNGSPRGKKSNTKILMDHFINGMDTIKNKWEINIHYLNDMKNSDLFVREFENSENIILAFPLYTDAMPGIVKHFIDKLIDVKLMNTNCRIGFVVQSGFPETVHSRYVERYLEKFSKRINAEYIGTIIKGGVEGIQVQPPQMTKKLYRSFEQLGVYFGEKGEFDKKIIKTLAGKEKLNSFKRFVFYALSKTGITNFYWNNQLKKNNVYKERFAQPYKRI